MDKTENEKLWIETITGVKQPYAATVFEMYIGAAVFLLVIFWPHLSVIQMVRGMAVAAFWVALGLVGFLREVSRHL